MKNIKDWTLDDVLDDKIKLAGVLIILVSILYIVDTITNLDSLRVPKIIYPDRSVVSGDCDWIKEKWLKLRAMEEGGQLGYIDPKLFEDEGKQFAPMRIEYPTDATTTTKVLITLPQTTTTTTLMKCPPVKVCPNCKEYKCEICPGCPSCDFKLTDKQRQDLINLHAKGGSAGYQAGYQDAVFDIMEYLKVEGRNKFRTSSPIYNQYMGYKQDDDGLICFVDANNKTPDTEFYLNNSIWMISNRSSMKWVHKI